MFDLEKRQIERAEELAKKEAEDLQTENRLNERARTLNRAIGEYTAKRGTARQPSIAVEQNKVRLRIIGDPAGTGLTITLHADETYEIFEVGGRISGHRAADLDKNAMMDRVLDWLTS